MQSIESPSYSSQENACVPDYRGICVKNYPGQWMGHYLKPVYTEVPREWAVLAHEGYCVGMLCVDCVVEDFQAVIFFCC